MTVYEMAGTLLFIKVYESSLMDNMKQTGVKLTLLIF